MGNWLIALLRGIAAVVMLTVIQRLEEDSEWGWPALYIGIPVAFTLAEFLLRRLFRYWKSHRS
jgi:Kef-type K+ transport system membrane component KefB